MPKGGVPGEDSRSIRAAGSAAERPELADRGLPAIVPGCYLSAGKSES